MQVTCSCSTKNNFQTFFSSSVNDRSGFSFLPPFFGPFCLFCWGFLEPPGRWALNFCEPWAIFANRKYTELFFFFFFASNCRVHPPFLPFNIAAYRKSQTQANTIQTKATLISLWFYYFFYCIDVKEKSRNSWLHFTALYSYTYI